MQRTTSSCFHIHYFGACRICTSCNFVFGLENIGVLCECGSPDLRALGCLIRGHSMEFFPPMWMQDIGSFVEKEDKEDMLRRKELSNQMMKKK